MKNLVYLAFQWNLDQQPGSESERLFETPEEVTVANFRRSRRDIVIVTAPGRSMSHRAQSIFVHPHGVRYYVNSDVEKSD